MCIYICIHTYVCIHVFKFAPRGRSWAPRAGFGRGRRTSLFHNIISYNIVYYINTNNILILISQVY